jgi:hypothetical protein
MDPKKTAPIIIAAALAGAGIGRATVPGAPAAKFERVCIEADGSAQVWVQQEIAHRQLLVPPDHTLAVMHREGGKATDIVPAGLSSAIKSVLSEAGKLAAVAK